MKKVIEFGKVYQGMYFVSYAVMALEDCYDLDDTVRVYDLKQARERYVDAHQLKEMQDAYALEYTQSELESVYPGWIDYIEERGLVNG